MRIFPGNNAARYSGRKGRPSCGTAVSPFIARAASTPRERGIIIADTKFEFGLYRRTKYFLIDECLTPDSSRFWPADCYKVGASPLSYDKQFVRDYLETLDWDKTPPAPSLPPEIIEKTARKYREAFPSSRQVVGGRGRSATTDPSPTPSTLHSDLPYSFFGTICSSSGSRPRVQPGGSLAGNDSSPASSTSNSAGSFSTGFTPGWLPSSGVMRSSEKLEARNRLGKHNIQKKFETASLLFLS